MRRWIDSIFIFTLQILAISQISPNDDFTFRTLSGGKIRGRQVVTEQNVTGYQFLGIPYAKPPVANLRYRKPIPIKKWENVIDATEYKQSNCLTEGGCAVMFYIHGGGYRYDTPSLFSPQFLVDNFLTEERSVVFVMPAYRLGSFGFLNLSPTFNTSAIKNIAFHGLEDEGYPFEGPCIDGPGGVLPEGIPKLRQKRYPIRLLIGSTTEEFSDTEFLVQPNGKADRRRLLSVCRKAVAEMAFKNTWLTTADCFVEYLDPSRAPHVFDDTSIFLSTALSGEDVQNAGGVSFLYEFQYRFVDGAFNFSRLSPPANRPQHTEDLVRHLTLTFSITT
uniref:Carboxylesterase type B domain-containing protein n=1 Tax=Parascaris equorum TaxID=6256 RepID=A0A914S1I4_PAREQ